MYLASAAFMLYVGTKLITAPVEVDVLKRNQRIFIALILVRRLFERGPRCEQSMAFGGSLHLRLCRKSAFVAFAQFTLVPLNIIYLDDL
jgi:hypothetical protein